jgi:hypothetical protein
MRFSSCRYSMADISYISWQKTRVAWGSGRPWLSFMNFSRDQSPMYSITIYIFRSSSMTSNNPAIRVWFSILCTATSSSNWARAAGAFYSRACGKIFNTIARTCISIIEMKKNVKNGFPSKRGKYPLWSFVKDVRPHDIAMAFDILPIALPDVEVLETVYCNSMVLSIIEGLNHGRRVKPQTFNS